MLTATYKTWIVFEIQRQKKNMLIAFRLTHPTEKDTARQKFKEYVNRLATMKQVKYVLM